MLAYLACRKQHNERFSEYIRLDILVRSFSDCIFGEIEVVAHPENNIDALDYKTKSTRLQFHVAAQLPIQTYLMGGSARSDSSELITLGIIFNMVRDENRARTK